MKARTEGARAAAPHRAYFAVEAWCMGALMAGLCLTIARASSHAWRAYLPSDWVLATAAVFVFSTVAAATLASDRRAHALEVGALLAVAHVPLALAQAAAVWVDARPHGSLEQLCLCVAHGISQVDLNHLSTAFECTALACLVTGAVGLTARRPSAFRNLLALLLLVGGVTRLRHLRIEAFNTYWERTTERLDHAFADPSRPRIEPGPLPWPLSGNVPALPRLSHRSVQLRLPDSNCAEPEYGLPDDHARTR